MKTSRLLLSSAATLALFSNPALAQTTDAPLADNVDSSVGSDIVVTGSRIARDGSDAPTPVSVVDGALLDVTPRTNLADTINLLPQFVGSQNSSIAANGPTNLQGQNLVNLRNLGANRTLVLIDGHRVPTTNIDGSVDLNVNLPQSLVKRVEVVTGGASAVYGSDAISGVVNFILDDEYEGIKGNVQTGITTYGDNPSFNAGITYGTSFADGRGHFLFNAEYAHEEGVRGVPRDWNAGGWRLLANPEYTATNGLPQYLIQDRVGLQIMTGGGIVIGGPLRGTAFGLGGEPYQFNYGTPAGALMMIGGDWAENNLNYTQQLWAGNKRHNAFGRVAYDLTDSITAHIQFAYSNSKTQVEQTQHFNIANISVPIDNAFLPESVRSQMQALNLSSLTLGHFNSDLPPTEAINENTVYNITAGIDGEFGMDWDWSVYGVYGRTELDTDQISSINANFAQAIDAVVDPSSGNVVCRSTLTNPGNGCVPYNILGIGVNSQDAIDYVMGVSPLDQVLEDWTVGLDLRGTLFEMPAGPLAVATGLSYRETSVRGETDEIGRAGGYFAANYVPTEGSYDVKEAYVEVSLPLARDQAWADSFVLDGAVRATDYSTAGYVTTWKVGGTYRLNPIGLRANLSRDIRAPSLGELFTPGATGFTTVTDPATGAAVVPTYLQTGNPNLDAEKATSWGVGAIFAPDLIRGLTASVDYYNIKIEDAISSVSNQQIVDRCFNGAQSFCDLVERDSAGNLTRILTSPVNFQELKASGLDFELGYQMPVGADGTISLRAFATHVLKYEQTDGISDPINAAGSISAPDWRWFATLTYKNDVVTASIANRGLSATNYNTTAYRYTECTTGCPASTPTNRTIDNNRIDGASYFDLNLAFNIETMRGTVEPYISVQNVFNKDPSINPASLFQGRAAVSNQFDLLGRVYRVGMRFDF